MASGGVSLPIVGRARRQQPSLTYPNPKPTSEKLTHGGEKNPTTRQGAHCFSYSQTSSSPSWDSSNQPTVVVSQSTVEAPRHSGEATLAKGALGCSNKTRTSSFGILGKWPISAPRDRYSVTLLPEDVQLRALLDPWALPHCSGIGDDPHDIRSIHGNIRCWGWWIRRGAPSLLRWHGLRLDLILQRCQLRLFHRQDRLVLDRDGLKFNII